MYNPQNPYNPFSTQNPYYPAQAQIQPRHEIIKVNGKGGAEAFQMAPNSSVLLLDETAPIVWLKTTDGAGFPTLAPYSITPYQPEPEINVKSLLQRIEKLEAIINEQSDTSSARKPRKSTGESSKTDV